MIVEFAGLPGSGKSAVAAALHARSAASGLPLLPVGQAARFGTLREDVFRRSLVSGLEGRAMMYHALQFRRDHPAFAALMSGAAYPVPEEDEFLALITGVQLGFARQRALRRTLVIFEEGFVQRGASLFFKLSDQGLSDYVRAMPLPDLVLEVEVDPDEAFERCQRRRPRGTSKHRLDYVIGKFGDRAAFRRRSAIFARALALTADRGCPVVRIDNRGGVEEAVRAAEDALHAIRPRDAEPVEALASEMERAPEAFRAQG